MKEGGKCNMYTKTTRIYLYQKLWDKRLYKEEIKTYRTCTQPLPRAPPPRYLFAKSTSTASLD